MLTYEEFQQTLLRLKEERSGVDPSTQDFGLEEIFRRERKLSGDDDHASAAGCPARSSPKPLKAIEVPTQSEPHRFEFCLNTPFVELSQWQSSPCECVPGSDVCSSVG